MADQKKKTLTTVTRQNVLESLKDLGSGATNQAGDLLKNTSEDFIRELMGIPRLQKKSGEIGVGESIQLSEVISGKEEENKQIYCGKK